MSQFDATELDGMATDTGTIDVTCEFCSNDAY